MSTAEVIYVATLSPDSLQEFHATKAWSASASHDLAPNEIISGRLADPGTIYANLWGERCTRGPRDILHGTVQLHNLDGALDNYIGYALQDKELRIRRYTDASPNVGSDIFIGLMEQPTVDEQHVTIYFREPASVLTGSIFEDYYLGNNTLPNGLEGTAELTGLPKPRAFGICRNITPVLVNSSRLVYQANADPLTGFATGSQPSTGQFLVYDKRVALSLGISRTLAEMQAGFTSFALTTGDTATDRLSISSTASFTTGDAISFTWTVAPPTTPGSLSQSTQYYIRVINSTQFQVHPTAADAVANTNRINFNGAGTGIGTGTTIAKNRTGVGAFDYCNDATAGFYVRLGSAAVGAVTMDLIQPCTTYPIGTPAAQDDTPSGLDHVMTTILSEFKASTPVYDPDGLLSGGGVGNETFLPEIGLYLTEEITALEVLEVVAASGGCAWPIRVQYAGSPPAVEWACYLRQLFEPSTGTSVLEIDESNILRDGDGPDAKSSLQRVLSEDDDRGIPVWKVTVEHRRNWTVMNLADIPGATAGDQALYVREYRTVTAEDAGVKLVYPFAAEITVTTLIDLPSDAQAEADRLLALYSTRRDFLSLDLDIEEVTGLEIGDVVNVTYPRYSLELGKQFLVIGLQRELSAGVASLILWG